MEGEGIEDGGADDAVVPCAHEWLACPECPARFERRHRRVLLPYPHTPLS